MVRRILPIFVLCLSSASGFIPAPQSVFAQDAPATTEDTLTYKYISFKVHERMAWGDDREWVKVDAPWGRELWGLLDAEGTFIHGPEFTSVKVHGDLAEVRYNWDIHGKPRPGTQARPFIGILDKDGIRCHVSTVYHSGSDEVGDGTPQDYHYPTYIEELKCWDTRDGKFLPTNEIPPEMASTPGIALGYLNQHAGARKSATEPIVGEEYFPSFDSNGEPRTLTTLYREEGLWGFITVKDVTEAEVYSSMTIHTLVDFQPNPLTDARFETLIPIRFDVWNAKQNQQVWLAQEGKEWQRLHIGSDGKFIEDIPVVWVAGANDWMLLLDDGSLHWSKHDAKYLEVQELSSVPHCFAAKTASGWGIVGSDGIQLLNFGNETSEAAWKALSISLETTKHSSPEHAIDASKLSIFIKHALGLSNKEELSKALAGLGANSMFHAAEFLSYADMNVDSELTKTVRPLVDSDSETPHAYTQVFDNLLQRFNLKRQLDAAWPKATLFEKKELTLNYVEQMIALTMELNPEGEDDEGAFLDNSYLLKFVADQSLRLYQSVPFHAYFDFLAQAPLFPGDGGGDIYAMPLSEEHVQHLASLQAETAFYTAGKLYYDESYDPEEIPRPNKLQVEMERRKHAKFLRRYTPLSAGLPVIGGVDSAAGDSSCLYENHFKVHLEELETSRTFHHDSSHAPIWKNVLGFSLGSYYEVHTLSLRMDRENPRRWLARGQAICESLATAGRSRSRQWKHYQGPADTDTPVKYSTGLHKNIDIEEVRTPVELWPLYRPRVVADIKQAKALGASEDSLKLIEFTVLFHDAAYESMKKGIIPDDTPAEAKEILEELSKDKFSKSFWRVYYRNYDCQTTWLITDEKMRIWEIDYEAKKAAEKEAQQASARAAKARAYEDREKARKEFYKKQAEFMKAVSQAQHEANRYYSGGASSHSTYMENKFNQYSNIMSGKNFSDWALRSGSSAWNVQSR